MSDRFFNSNNKAEGITSDDYAHAKCYTQAAEAIVVSMRILAKRSKGARLQLLYDRSAGR